MGLCDASGMTLEDGSGVGLGEGVGSGEGVGVGSGVGSGVGVGSGDGTGSDVGLGDGVGVGDAESAFGVGEGVSGLGEDATNGARPVCSFHQGRLDESGV